VNQALLDKLVNAVLYEGYILYPYRPSIKNHQRWTFGGLFPETWNMVREGFERSLAQTECLLETRPETKLDVRIRFLHLTQRTVGRLEQPIDQWTEGIEPPFVPVESLQIGQTLHQAWQEATERDVSLDGLPAVGTLRRDFAMPAHRELEPLRNEAGEMVGVLVRRQEALSGQVQLICESAGKDLSKITVRVSNRTPLNDPSMNRDEAVLRSFASTHVILVAHGGAFVSAIDPPQQFKPLADQCRNTGLFPVLVGDAGARDTMLASPIILYDYPQIAPESPGDLFDSTEIDEILSLRVMTLTDQEKQAVAGVDERARRLLARTDAMAREQLASLHGTIRGLRPVSRWEPSPQKREMERTLAAGIELKPGDRVVLHPKGKADIFDIALAGKTATIAGIEQDFENRIHVAVTIDDDPGADMGQFGHRFFFSLEEVEPLPSTPAGGSA
jgi:hypothetical protein